MAQPRWSRFHNTCEILVSGSNTNGGPLPQMSLADPTPDRTDADRAGPSPPQETVTPPEVGPVAAPPLAVTTAMEEDADPAGPGARRRDAPFAPATRDARSEPGALGSIGVRAVTARTSCFAS